MLNKVEAVLNDIVDNKKEVLPIGEQPEGNLDPLGKEVVQLRAENKELRRIIGLGITYQEPLILNKDMEVTDGH
jgi:hypothetical protein